MTDEPFRPDPADAVPPGERAALADTARHLVGERADLADTAQHLVGERADLTEVARKLVKSNDALAKTAVDLTKKLKHRTVAFFAVVAFDLALTVIIIVIGFRVSAASECQATQNDAFQAASAASRESRDRQDDQQLKQLDQQLALFSVTLSSATTPEQRLAAVNDYVTAVTALKTAIINAKQKRADNPLPTGDCSRRAV